MKDCYDYNHEVKLQRLLLTGECQGSCGTAIIAKNCIARYNNNNAVRNVCKGTLIQVWQLYDDVIFSPLESFNERCELEVARLTCKYSDIIKVPSELWGALFPLSPDQRVNIARNEGLAERLASIKQNSHVDLYDDGKRIAEAQVVTKICYISGAYYGIKIKASPDISVQLAEHVSLVPDDLPAGCDAIVDLKSFLPAAAYADPPTNRPSLSKERNVSRNNIPKSASHNTLRYSDETITGRASISIDLHNTKLIDLKKTLNDSTAPVHKTHTTSRSLDLPSAGEKRLTRDRACTSLDSGSCASKINEFEKFKNSDLRGIGELTVGSLIEFSSRSMDEPLFGVIRWVGQFPDSATIMAGVELEEETDSHHDTRGLFDCPPSKTIFVKLSQCRRDSRFLESARRQSTAQSNSFGHKTCPVVEGVIPPIFSELKDICGKDRGIQGHNNSCYLDATLFAMFAFTSVMDSLLYRPRSDLDHTHYEEVQRVLRDEIVNPLRKNLYVRADRVMKLRTLLDKLSSVTGLTSEEKDPEEFLNSLLTQILKAKPFLQLSSGQEAFYYQLFVDKDERLTLPNVQQLLEQSFLSSDIKLKHLPSCLIVQMPRFGKSFKMYPRIIPSTTIDVTDLIENSPRQCTVCGKLAQYECKECYGDPGLDGGSYCSHCMTTVHGHQRRVHHKPTSLRVPSDCHDLVETGAVPRLTMDLFAVVCIETSHYVAFLNTDRGWAFFDSMADRKGEQNGYNIPEIVNCPELSFWFTEEGAERLSHVQDEKDLPMLPKRLLCDAYMCLYQSPQVMMYR